MIRVCTGSSCALGGGWGELFAGRGGPSRDDVGGAFPLSPCVLPRITDRSCFREYLQESNLFRSLSARAALVSTPVPHFRPRRSADVATTLLILDPHSPEINVAFPPLGTPLTIPSFSPALSSTSPSLPYSSPLILFFSLFLSLRSALRPALSALCLAVGQSSCPSSHFLLRIQIAPFILHC